MAAVGTTAADVRFNGHGGHGHGGHGHPSHGHSSHGHAHHGQGHPSHWNGHKRPLVRRPRPLVAWPLVCLRCWLLLAVHTRWLDLGLLLSEPRNARCYRVESGRWFGRRAHRHQRIRWQEARLCMHRAAGFLVGGSMSDESRANYCFECKQPLTEIDNRGRSAAGLYELQHLVVAELCQGAAIRGGPRRDSSIETRAKGADQADALCLNQIHRCVERASLLISPESGHRHRRPRELNRAPACKMRRESRWRLEPIHATELPMAPATRMAPDRSHASRGGAG